VGHDKIVGVLASSLKEERLAHAYLFVGPPHVGKMTLAIELAKALNCDDDERPCGRCSQCQRIAEGKHADVQVIGLNGRVEIGIDHIRDVQRAASLRPFEGRNRVFIIDGAEHLSHEAANCLLKVLEEPPPQVQLVLLAVNERLLLPTVLSRCQKLTLRPLPEPVVESALIERWHVAPDRARILARLSSGCLGWAVAAQTDDHILSQRWDRLGTLIHLASAGREERFTYAAQLANQFSRGREAVQEVLSLWIGWWRDLLLIKGGCGHFTANVDQEATLCREAEAHTLNEIKEFIQSLEQAMEQLDQNANPRLVLEVLMLSMPKRSSRPKGISLSEA